MKKGKKSVKFAPVFRPAHIGVQVVDQGMQFVGQILDIQYDGGGNILIIVRYR